MSEAVESEISDSKSRSVPAGYKQTEVGVIPEDWQVLSLSDLTDPQRPISYGIVQTGPNVPNGVRCLRVLDIHDGRINKSELITTSQGISDSYRRTVLRAGDLVMPLRGKVGDVGIVDAELEGANLTRGVALIAIRSAWSPVFCQQAIASTSTRRRLEQAMNGSALQEIPIATLRTFKIATPKTLAEQRAIATALSDVDALLGALERLIAKKRDLKQAAMQQLLTGQTRLPGFTGEWEEKSVGSVCKLINGRGFKPHEWRTTGLPIIRIQNLNGSDDFNYFEGPYAKKLEVENGQLLFAWSGSRGTSFGPHVWRGSLGLLNYHTWKVLVDDRAISKEFFLHALKKLTTFIEDRAHGASALVHTQKWEMEGFTLPVPPTTLEQTAIAEVLSDMDAEIERLEQRREKTRALKQGMMQELLTGKTRLV